MRIGSESFMRTLNQVKYLNGKIKSIGNAEIVDTSTKVKKRPTPALLASIQNRTSKSKKAITNHRKYSSESFLGSAKEHDTEIERSEDSQTPPKNKTPREQTGYSYPSTGSGLRFGARYYDSDLSVWLSVDPLADKYPSQSPFMYCYGNPLDRVDQRVC